LKSKTDERCLALENNMSGTMKEMDNLNAQATVVRAPVGWALLADALPLRPLKQRFSHP